MATTVRNRSTVASWKSSFLAPAQGSGALGLGLLFRIGRHFIPHSSNNNKHRRDLEEVDLWERDVPEESLWERELPEEEFWARDVPEQEFWERDVPEQELWEREVPAAAEGSGALGFGLVKDVLKAGSHLFG
ncbi:uncharacterized protein B0H18DRAFT_29632 [Fomitopsis serialis]|uniref:uncharacterized protein n=1 Tax=Fomitopsis serialis TaxID=139415 RepID=UPI0020084430|nr:uncharacterized protein B0H18DRAFT_29632 [Neoantrodia serialis]KAH9932558.1 hypothetical protein B0H18DRAFT_29632 [Neoantrodia serialis]